MRYTGEKQQVALVVDVLGAATPIAWALSRHGAYTASVGDVQSAKDFLETDRDVRVVVLDQEIASLENVAMLQQVFSGGIVVIDDLNTETPNIAGTIAVHPDALVQTVVGLLHSMAHV
jgi:hypothetical protein